AQDRFMMTFRSITRTAVTRDVNARIKMFGEMGSALKRVTHEWSESDNAFARFGASFIKRASAVNQLGLRGLIINLDEGEERATAFGAALTLLGEGLMSIGHQLQPLLLALGPMYPLLEKVAIGLSGLIKRIPGVAFLGRVIGTTVGFLTSW